jgi:peptidoglycan/LPS O-acetylase OafA/YrhL
MTTRLRSLDGLRGVAAVVVLIHHSLLTIPALAGPYYADGTRPEVGTAAWWLVYSPLHVFWEGSGAVYVFFVLSGIVLTLPVLSSRQFGWIAYYPQRLLRLYVPVWVAILFAVATVLLVSRAGDTGSLWIDKHQDGITLGSVLRDVTLVISGGAIISPLWSLRWEVLFSLALPLFVWVAVKGVKFTAVIAVLCVAVVALGGVLNNQYLQYLPMFMLGALIGVSLPKLRSAAARIKARRRSGPVWLAAAGIAAVLITSRWTLLAAGAPTLVVNASIALALVGATLIVLVAAFSDQAQKLLEVNTIQWLGRISFSLYLVHEPIVVAFANVFGPDAVGWSILCSIVTSFLVAAVFYRFIEHPSYLLARSVRSRLAQTPKAVKLTE